MKPKIFIGSSVEGLNIAYAVQQNLTYDAECTVWDQGLFELSKTTIESLDTALQIMDFGIFVFSNDDIIIMRDMESSTIRDNVLFEFGLFIGKLGRKRVFFITPQGSSLHMPTDLLGVTSGKYDPNREDGSLQSATGAVCNQIRTQIKKLGLIRQVDEFEDATESIDKLEINKNEWLKDFINNDFLEAKEKLIIEMSSKSGDDLLIDRVWLTYINFKLDENKSLKEIYELSENHSESIVVQSRIIRFLLWEDYIDKAIELAETALIKIKDKNEILIKLAECYQKNDNLDKAISLLKYHSPYNHPAVAIALADIYEDKNEAIELMHATYKNFPNNEDLVYKYARLLHDENHNEQALYLYSFLTKQYDSNVEYWGYLGNVCNNLGLNDKAMSCYKKAEDLAKSNEAWILQNIGNLLNNKGFYSDAIQWLKKGLVNDEESQYAHDRLARAIKSKEEENKKYQEKCDEGRKLLRNFKPIEQVDNEQPLLLSSVNISLVPNVHVGNAD